MNRSRFYKKLDIRKSLLLHILVISLAFLGCNKSSDSNGGSDSIAALSLLTGASASENSVDNEPDNRTRREFHGFLNQQDGQPCRECKMNFIESSNVSPSSLFASIMGKASNQRLTLNIASNQSGKYTAQLPESKFKWEVRNQNNTEILSKGSLEIRFSDPQPSFIVDPGSQLQVTIYDSENTQPADGIITGISPNEGGVFFSQYQELGNHYEFGNNCANGSNFTLEKFRLTSNTVASIEFGAPVSIENAVLVNLGEPSSPIVGTLREINPKRFNFETNAPGIPFATYKIRFSGIKALESGRNIEDKSWNFSIGFDPTSEFGKLNQVSINCADQGGTNVCQYQATMHFSGSKEGIPDNSKNPYSVFHQGTGSFFLTFMLNYHPLLNDGTPNEFPDVYQFEMCDAISTIPVLESNKFVYIKMTGQTWTEIPVSVVEENRFSPFGSATIINEQSSLSNHQILTSDDFEETIAIQN